MSSPDLLALLDALDIPAKKLLKLVEASFPEARPSGTSDSVFDIPEHPAVYEALLTYVNERTGKLLAVRQELYRKLQEDRTDRARRREDIEGR